MSHELTAYFSIFNLFKLNELWPYYQKHVNEIILNHTTKSIALQIFELANLLLNQTPDILALCETNLDELIDPSKYRNFFGHW